MLLLKVPSTAALRIVARRSCFSLIDQSDGSSMPGESADPPPGPVWAKILPPGWAAFVDRDRVSADLILGSQLVVVLGGHLRRAVGDIAGSNTSAGSAIGPNLMR